VDVDDDRPVAERLADEAGDSVERRVELALGPDAASGRERVTQPCERRMGSSRHLGYSSASEAEA
jgi:hypothetical protein